MPVLTVPGTVDALEAPAGRWDAADTPRRACLILGALVAAYGFGQLTVLFLTLDGLAALGDAIAANGAPCCRSSAGQSALGLFFHFPLNAEVLYIAPVVVGIAGLGVYWLRRPIAARVVVGAATSCLVIAAIATLDIGSIDAPSVEQLLSPVSGYSVIAVPCCVALGVFSVFARARTTKGTSRRPAGASRRDRGGMSRS